MVLTLIIAIGASVIGWAYTQTTADITQRQ